MVIGEWWRRLWYFVNRTRLQRELEAEMAAHREMMTDPRRFGNVTRLREEAQDVWRWAWLAHAWQDFHHACRVLSRLPGFALTATLILALGIGLNLTFFHLLNVIVLQPLPLKGPETLVRLHRRAKTFTSNGFPYPVTQVIRHDNAVLSCVLPQHRTRVTWHGDAAGQVEAAFVSANWFSELGHPAVQGRVFAEEIDERPDAQPAIVVSYEFWQTRLGGAPDIPGRAVRVNGRPATIIGVAPAGFPGLDLDDSKVWLLIHQIDYFNPGMAFKDAWGSSNTALYARLKPGLSPAAAAEGLRPVIADLARARPRDVGPEESFDLASGADRFRLPREQREVWTAASLVGGLALLVLVVASANLGNLVLTHAIGRLRELSLRSALGASRNRIVSHLAVESLLLAIGGAIGGLVLGYAGARALAAATELPAYLDFTPDWRLLVAAFLVALVAMLAFGLTPAWMIGRRDLTAALKDGGQQASAGLARARFRLLLIGCQVAGCCALLIVAGVMTRGLQRLLVVDLGFRFDRVAVIDASLGRIGVRGEPARAYWYEVAANLAARPDVERLALVSSAPLGDSVSETRYNDAPGVKTTIVRVEPAFFPLMEIPILQGRNFEPSDDHREVVIISRRLAAAMYGTVDVVGKPFPKSGSKRTIIGVAGDAPFIKVRALDVVEQYMPLNPAEYDQLVLIARARTDPELLLKPMRAAASAADPRVFPATRLLRSDFDEKLRAPRLASLIAGLTALLALAIACLGIFGVVSYGVTLRTKEIGIRRALGAGGTRIVGLVIQQLAWPVCVGMLAGIPAGVLTGRLFEREPFYLAFTDVTGPTVALVVFALTAVAAALHPASRALGGDPLKALRHD